MNDFNFDKTFLCSGVYAIKCLQNNRYYIGSSENIYNRLQNHKNMLNNGLHFNLSMRADYKKGYDFKCKIILMFNNNESQATREIVEHLIMIELMSYGYNLYNLDSVPLGTKAVDYFYKKGAGRFKHEYDLLHKCYQFNYFESKERD